MRVPARADASAVGLRLARPTLGALVFLGLAAMASQTWAGAFNEPQGHGLVIVEGLFDTGHYSFDVTGHRIKTDPYGKLEGSTYIQYGVTDWLMAVVKPDFVSTRVGGTPPGHYTGFGTSEAGAQVQLPSIGPFSFALQGTFHLPASDHPQNRALVGNTSRDTDGRGLAGAVFTLGPYPGFVDLEAGYRVRGAQSPDEVHVDLTGGVRVKPNVLLLMQSFTTAPTQAGTPLYPRSTYSNLEGSAVYDFDPHWSVQAGLFGTVYGRNALRERGVDTAVWYRF